MSTTFLDRYVSGERLEVWKELIAIGPSAGEAPQNSQAIAVAQEIVDRAYANLTFLRNVLLDVGYEFAHPDHVLVEATPTTIKTLRELECQFGSLPIILRIWYERFLSVDFRQSQKQLFMSPDTVYSDVAGLGCNCVLVFLDLERCLCLREKVVAPPKRPNALCGGKQVFLPLGSFASNNEAKGFWLPNGAVDSVLYNDGGGDICFVDQLRKAFKWGGFPFWGVQFQKNRRHVLTPVGSVPNFPKLLPLLLQGIAPI